MHTIDEEFQELVEEMIENQKENWELAKRNYEALEENLEKKKELWQYLKAKDGGLYFRLRHGLFGRTMNLPGRGGRKLSVAAYKISQKFYGFN